MNTISFDQFVGLDGLVRRLGAEFGENRYVHAYLFSGPAGTGKRAAAEICARAVHCAGEPRPCGKCPSCQRMLAGTHPDHTAIGASGRSIGVDEVRELIRRVSVKPFEGGRHTVVIDDAEKLTPQAQNALLKTLETPPGGAVFFLLTSSPARMLPTIVSRCRQARFHPVSAAQAEQALIAGGAPQVRARLAAVASGGCIGRAWEQLQDEGYWAARDRVIQSLKALKGPSSVAEAAARLAQDRDGAQQTLEILESLARDVIRAECAPAPGQRELNPEDLAVDGEALLMGVLSARQKLNANVSWQTVLEMMYFDSLRGSIPWQQ